MAGEEMFGRPSVSSYDDTAWGGRRNEYKFVEDGSVGPYGIPGGHSVKVGPSGREADVDRYRSMGAAQANSAAPQIDTTQYNQSRGAAYADRSNAMGARGSQQDALGMMRQAAMGTAPSRAEILGQQMAGQSLDAQMAMAAGARGGALNQAAAMRNAQMGSAQYMQQSQQQMAALRADEMARARDAYMGGASTIRGQDYQGAAQAADMMGRDAAVAGAQADLDFRQRAMNQQAQQFYEQLGWNTNNAALQAELQGRAIDEGAYQFGALQNERSDARNDAFWGNIIGTGAGLFGLAAMASDERSKREVRSLSMGTAPPWMPADSSYLLTSDSKTKQEQRALGQAEGVQAAMGAGYSAKPGGAVAMDPYASGPQSYTGGLVRENPYGEPGIVRENPYGQAPPAAPGQAQSPNWAAMGRVLGSGISQAMGGGSLASYGAPPPPQMSMSDERSKEGMRGTEGDPRGAEPAKMLDSIGSGISYRYKPGVGEDPERQRFGTTTQALRSTPMGASFVTHLPNGYEAIDTREAVGPMLSAMGNLNERLRKVEGRGGRM